MYQIKIYNEVEKKFMFEVADGEQLIREDGTPMEVQAIDEATKTPQVDGNGDPVMEPFLNQSGESIFIEIDRPAEDVAAEEQAVKDAKAAEIQAKCDAYEAAKEYQKQNGGPGPVAEFDIMKICNEHNGQFEVIFED